MPRSSLGETGVEFGQQYIETFVGARRIPRYGGTVGDVDDEGVDKAGDRVWIGFDVDIDAPLGSDGRGRGPIEATIFGSPSTPTALTRSTVEPEVKTTASAAARARRPLSSMSAETVR